MKASSIRQPEPNLAPARHPPAMQEKQCEDRRPSLLERAINIQERLIDLHARLAGTDQHLNSCSDTDDPRMPPPRGDNLESLLVRIQHEVNALEDFADCIERNLFGTCMRGCPTEAGCRPDPERE